MSTVQSSTRLGFVPAAQVTRTQLVQLAEAALIALTQFMQALKPKEEDAVQRLGKIEPRSIAWAESASDEEGGNAKARKRAAVARTQEKVYSGTGVVNCPECGDEMVERTRRSNGSKFYGCINYPTCQATIDAQKFSSNGGRAGSG